ncbi:carbohydrate kinase family protein [Kitasatospora viridis]|uniref:Sugar/nucleoside kinase (Ribokinase family) n=1 Tax=Kitasatospora viridis TaxID=281105 RepID=A0A561UPQ5_9ACTN|nr:PfkB family carbohydrate kinase [Kitasatospora viridis]TWG01357.1 sugar/nucleoside kinase (ribokinase family) [Kitasatospora viridis]
MKPLLVIGDVVTDIVARHRAPLAAQTDTAARISVQPGGSAGNTAAWAVSSGCREVRLLARVGADSADWHRSALTAAGVSAHLVVDQRLSTGVVIALVDSAAERSFVTDGGAAAALCTADWLPGLLAGAGLLHLSGYLFFPPAGRELARLAIHEARAAGVPVCVDPASTGFLTELGTASFWATAADVDLLLPNLAEARLLSGEQDPEAAARALSHRVGTAVVKLGPDGAVAARDGAVIARAPGTAARAVDSTGAGDAFAGGYLTALLAGADQQRALAAGCLAGARAVEVVGGRPERF